MKTVLKLAATAVGTLCATTTLAADYHIQRSLELTAPAVDVWNLIGDFCDIDDWHPEVTRCSLKAVEGSLVRFITPDDGTVVSQKRIAEEPGLSYTYKVISSALPVENFTATLSIEPFEKPLVAWSAWFSSDDPAMEQAVVNEIEAGLSAIESIFTAR